MEGLLAFSGMLSLAVGACLLLAAIVLSIITVTTREANAKAKAKKQLKSVLLMGVLLFMAGFGICTLQLSLYPLNFH